MVQLHAQPYDISASGFFFEDTKEYDAKRRKCLSDVGQPVEEFEIQFIDGEDIDAELFKALGINQATFPLFLEKVDEWDDSQKKKIIIAVGECGYSVDLNSGDPDDFDIDLYEMDSLRELAEHFVEEGLFGEIPERIRFYLDYDAMARDLGMDYSETTIAGQSFIYRCS